MPSSRPNHIPAVLGVMLRLEPTSVLDIGTGFGKWGLLIREYTDIRLSEREPERYDRENWRVRIDGIEGFPRYLTPVHHHVYDNLYVGDMREVIDGLGRYDMILLGDVIEHVEKAQGEELMRKCLDHCSGAVVVSTPAVFREQGEACGNVLETHRSFWRSSDFGRFRGARTRVVANDILVAVIPASGVTAPPIAGPGETVGERLSRRWGRLLVALRRRLLSGASS
jgi:hypothetical protein